MHRDLTKLTVVELREKCKRKKIKGSSKMSKSKLISCLHKHKAMKMMKKSASKKVKKTKRRSMKGGEIEKTTVKTYNNGKFNITLEMENGKIKEIKGKLGEQIEGYEANGPITKINDKEIAYQLPLGNIEVKSLKNFFNLEAQPLNNVFKREENVQTTKENNVQNTEEMVKEINSLSEEEFKQLKEAFEKAQKNRAKNPNRSRNVGNVNSNANTRAKNPNGNARNPNGNEGNARNPNGNEGNARNPKNNKKTNSNNQPK